LATFSEIVNEEIIVSEKCGFACSACLFTSTYLV